MRLSPYLMFNGQCEAAFKFYQQCLGGKITAIMTFGESPMAEQTPPELLNQVMHMQLTVDDIDLMGSDCPPEYFQQPQGFHVTVQLNDPSEAERIFNTLSAKGSVQMPLQETFWAAKFGMCVDQFGTPWMINCELA